MKRSAKKNQVKEDIKNIIADNTSMKKKEYNNRVFLFLGE